MTDSPNSAERVLELAEAVVENEANPRMLLELDHLLMGDADSRKLYFDFCRLQVALRLELRAERAASLAHRHIEIESADPFAIRCDDSARLPSNAQAYGVFRGAFGAVAEFFSHEMALSWLVAALVMSSALLLGWRFNITHYRQVADTDNPPGVPTASERYVGRVTDMKDCRWADPSAAPMIGSRIMLGRRYSLQSGLLELTYDGGARVILEGPCSYTVDSAAGGFLRQGKLVARVEKKVASGQWPVARIEEGVGSGERRVDGKKSSNEPIASAASEKLLATSHQPLTTNPQSPAPSPQSPLSTLHSPLFTITTPTAVVTDLGTEFGVEVSPEAGTEVHVFQGRVEAKWIGSTGNEKKVRLNAGEGAGFDVQRSAVNMFSAQPGDFPRAFASVRRPVDVAAKKTIVACSGVYGSNGAYRAEDAWANSGRFSVRCVNNGVTDERTQEGVYWLGREGVAGEYFIIDLWGHFDVERIELMNTHNSRGNDRGTNDFEIWAADEINGTELVAPRLVLRGKLPSRFGAGNNIPYDVFSAEAGDFSPFKTRYVMFVAKTYHHGNKYGGCGLNEIKVFALPAKNLGDSKIILPADDIIHNKNAGAITRSHKEPHDE